MADCAYRRTPYDPFRSASTAAANLPAERPTQPSAVSRYTVAEKALRRWSRENLTLDPRQDGEHHARFTYAGSTCTDMGTPMAATFEVRLGPSDTGYRILGGTCIPAPGDTGYRTMCTYVTEGAQFLATVAAEVPLLGEPLDSVLEWQPKIRYSGCLCSRADRYHKWRVALQTIHYAINHDINADP